MTHCLHDASSKKGKQILQTGACLEKNGRVIHAPVGLGILKNGESLTEADAIMNALVSSVNGGAEAKLAAFVSVVSDGANGAGATSDEIIARRAEQLKADP